MFDQEFVPHTPGTVLDSGAQVNLLEGTLGSGTRFQLTGITGATTEAERADAVFPVITADGSRHAISIRGKNIVATRTTDNILSLAVLLKAGYKVNFRVGTDLDPTDGGDLYTPKGMMIVLLLFFQKQNLASAVYLFGLGTRPSDALRTRVEGHAMTLSP